MSNKENIEITILIDRYIKGELSQKEIDQLWIEFLENPEYYDLFETDLHLRDLAKSGENPFDEEPPQKAGVLTMWSSYKKWAYAAAAAVLISVSLQLFTMDKQAYELAITSIDQQELAGADVLRSDDEENTEINVSINQALALAYSDQADEAIDHFKNLLDQPLDEHQSARVEMNLGILLYNKSDYETAGEYFISVTETEGLSVYFEEKAWWFLGNAYLNMNEIEKAREAVFNAYSLDGRFNKPALALLKRLDLELGNILPDVDRLNTE